MPSVAKQQHYVALEARPSHLTGDQAYARPVPTYGYQLQPPSSLPVISYQMPLQRYSLSRALSLSCSCSLSRARALSLSCSCSLSRARALFLALALSPVLARPSTPPPLEKIFDSMRVRFRDSMRVRFRSSLRETFDSMRVRFPEKYSVL